MRAAVDGIGVRRIEIERPLQQRDAALGVADLDPRPAERGEKPPVLLAPGRRHALQQRDLLRLEVFVAAESEQPVDAERERQRHRVAGPGGGMVAH